MKQALLIVVVSSVISFLFAIFVFTFTAQGGSFESLFLLGDCGSPLFGFPCPGEFVLPFVIVVIGTIVGFFLFKKLGIQKIGLFLILLIVIQFLLLWPEYMLRSAIKSQVTTNDFNQSTQADLSSIHFAIVVPTYLPSGYELSQAITFGSNIGRGAIKVMISYSRGTDSISINEEKLNTSYNPPTNCLNEESTIRSCSLALKTSNGNEVYSFNPSLQGGWIKFGSAFLEIEVTDKSITEDELSKVVDSFHTIEKSDFYNNFYLKTSNR